MIGTRFPPDPHEKTTEDMLVAIAPVQLSSNGGDWTVLIGAGTFEAPTIYEAVLAAFEKVHPPVKEAK